jgi:hypothetical protein
MRRHWGVWLFIAWVMWISKTQQGAVSWSPMREFPDRELKDFTPQQYCEMVLAAFHDRPDFKKRLRCLPAGVRPEGAVD